MRQSDLEAQHSNLLQRTRARRLQESSKDENGEPLPALQPTALVPECELASSVSDIVALERHLEAVRALREHYSALYGAFLGHLPALASALQAECGLPLLHGEEKAAPRREDETTPGAGAPVRDVMVASSTGALRDGLDSAQQAAADPAVPSLCKTEARALFEAQNGDAAAPGSNLLGALQQHVASFPGVASHEQIAASAGALDMDGRHALGVLCSETRRYYLHSTAVLIGRGSESRGEVRA
jgi:hypothetical protein